MGLGSGGRKCIMEVFWYLLAPIWLLRGQRQRHSRICWLPCPSIYLCIIPSFIHSVSQPTFTCCCCCQVASVVSDSLRPHRQQPTRLPLSLGFSRQEHWSELPFPSPMHESEKWKWSHSVMEQKELSIHWWWEWKMVHSLWKIVWWFLARLNILKKK